MKVITLRVKAPDDVAEKVARLLVTMLHRHFRLRPDETKVEPE